jgi:hypothetical protein
MQRGTVLAYLYPGPDPPVDYDVSNGEIVRWNEATLGPRPTEAQLRDAWLPALRAQKVAEIRRRAAEEAEKAAPVRQVIYLTRTRVADPRLLAWEAVCKKERDLVAAAEKATTEEEVLAVKW